MDVQNLILTYQRLPTDLQQEVFDFIEYIVQKYQKRLNKPKPLAGKNKSKRTSNFGSAKGLIVMSPDFDEPLADFNEYM